MILPVAPTLALKFLVWALALAVFLRTLAPGWRAMPGEERSRAAALLFGAIAGAKVVFALAYPLTTGAALTGSPAALLRLAGMGSAPGAVLGAALSIWAMQSKQPGRVGAELDALIVPAALALIVLDCGSVCWALGDPGFGLPTQMPWGVDFGDGVPRQPVMLFEAALLGAAVWAYRRSGDTVFAPGERALLFVAAYCAIQLPLGYLKPPFGAPLLVEILQPYPWVYAGVMTGEQWVCLGAVLTLLPGWWGIVRRLLRNR
jgi:hypothetical protein